MSVPNPNVPVSIYQMGLEADVMGASGNEQVVALGLYAATGERFAQTIEPPQDGVEYVRKSVVARGLESLGAVAASEEAALHRLAFARLVRSATSLAHICRVDLFEAFEHIFPDGGFDGTVDHFDRRSRARPEFGDQIVRGHFGWSIMQTIGHDTLAVYRRAHGDFMNTAERALKFQRPPGTEALTQATGRWLHAVSWILQARLNFTLAGAIRLTLPK